MVLFEFTAICDHNLSDICHLSLVISFSSAYGLVNIDIWALIPEKVKKVTSLDIFKLKIKEFCFNDCPCSLCKDYISGVGFMN